MISSNKNNLAIYAGAGAAAFAIGGLLSSAIANRVELGNAYQNAYINALSEQLPNLVFNLGVAFGSDKASKITAKITQKLSEKAVEMAEEQVLSTLIDSIAEVVAQQIGMDGQWAKEGMKEVKKPLNQAMQAGREQRSLFIWRWAKKITSPVHFAFTPLLLAAGEVNARQLEREGKLDELTLKIKTYLGYEEQEEAQLRSMNIIKHGFVGFVCNSTYNLLSTAASMTGALQGRIDAAKEEGLKQFEQAISLAISERTGNAVDLKEITNKLGLKSLMAERYHSCLTGSMETTSVLAGRVMVGVQQSKEFCYDFGNFIYADLQNPALYEEVLEEHLFY